MFSPKNLYQILKYGKRNLTPTEMVLRNSQSLIEKNNAIFIHIPKAAGISLTKSLFGQESLGHFKMCDYILKYGAERTSNLFSFTFIRNPYDRIFSAYNYLKKGGRNKKTDLKDKIILEKYSDFESFILNFYRENDFREIQHFIPQYMWLENENNEIEIDFIGKFENIESDYKKLLNLHLFPDSSELVHLNYSDNKFMMEKIYSDQMIAVINKIYEKDFLLFNYKMY